MKEDGRKQRSAEKLGNGKTKGARGESRESENIEADDYS